MADCLFVECRVCGERWKVASLPVTLDTAWLKAMKHTRCPNCGERKEIHVCPTNGEGAVTEARNGKRRE